MDADGAAQPAELIRTAMAARASGDVAAARAAFAAAYDGARRSRDVAIMTEAALGLAANQMWGMLPGSLPAFLHEAYEAAEGEGKCRLAAALARAWGYAGQPSRAAGFAAEAVARAEEIGNRALLADALDADLLVHWGPDDFDERLRLTTRLEETVAHLGDVEARLSAHLWCLTTALERLDRVRVQRQLRALDLLAAESGSARVAFFALSRQGMAALLRGDTATANALLDRVRESGARAGEADAFALEHTLAAGIARQTGDRAAMLREAEVFEDYGTREGAPAVTAQGALFLVDGGERVRAERLLRQVAAVDFGHLVRDAEWMLTITSLTEVAARVGATDLAAVAIGLLEPYAGRGVVNGGGVAFEGVVDAYLAQACAALGRDEQAARWTHAARVAYQRLGAPWWAARLERSQPGAAADAMTFHIRPTGHGTWTVGRDGDTVALRETIGFSYLRLLLRNAGVPIAALALSDAVAHPGEGIDEADRGEIIDRQALSEYRRRLADIDDEMEDLQHHSDDRRMTALAAERDALLEQVSAATGIGGRRRRDGAGAERARVAVRKAITAAIGRIDGVDPETAAMLRVTVRTGFQCTYDPDRAHPVRWVLD